MRSRFLAPVVVVALSALPALAAPRVEGVKLERKDGGVDVVVTASEPLTFQSWLKQSPQTVVVDLLEAEGTPQTLAGAGPIKAIEISRHDARGVALTRLSLPLLSTQDYDVSARGNTVTISVYGQGTRQKVDVATTLKPNVTPPVLVASSDSGIVEGEMGRATATDAPLFAQADGGRRSMTYIGFRNTGTQSRVFARMNDAAEFNVRKEGDNLIVLEIKNATIPLRNNKNHLDATFFDSPVKMITPSEIEDATPTIRITIEMKSAVPFETRVEGREIAIYFKK
jgi:hypothetical protein